MALVVSAEQNAAKNCAAYQGRRVRALLDRTEDCCSTAAAVVESLSFTGIFPAVYSCAKYAPPRRQMRRWINSRRIDARPAERVAPPEQWFSEVPGRHVRHPSVPQPYSAPIQGSSR